MNARVHCISSHNRLDRSYRADAHARDAWAERLRSQYAGWRQTAVTARGATESLGLAAGGILHAAGGAVSGFFSGLTAAASVSTPQQPPQPLMPQGLAPVEAHAPIRHEADIRVEAAVPVAQSLFPTPMSSASPAVAPTPAQYSEPDLDSVMGRMLNDPLLGHVPRVPSQVPPTHEAKAKASPAPSQGHVPGIAVGPAAVLQEALSGHEVVVKPRRFNKMPPEVPA